MENKIDSIQKRQINRHVFLFISLLTGILTGGLVNANNVYYGRSYAVVIGIDQYNATRFNKLPFSKKDAREFGNFLRDNGFTVHRLYDHEATKLNIKSTIQNLAKDLRAEDRVIIFFSGHGFTERIADEDFGSIVPYDGTNDSATYISMAELRDLSRRLGQAKHQLFIIDACFAGLLAKKDSTAYLDKPYPGYLKRITTNAARQYITAGGSDQRVRGVGPKGFSYFTGYLLEGLTEGKADLYPDGYITYPELVAYLTSRASNVDQTPVPGNFEKHGEGQFVFESPIGALIEPEPEPPPAPLGGYKSGDLVPFGIIRVMALIKGAVYIDEKYKSAVDKNDTYEYLNIQVGEHEVKLFGYDNKEYKRKVMVENGKIASVTLPSGYTGEIKATGSIVVSSPELSGEVYIDGKYLGDISVGESKTFSNIPVGRHKIEIRGVEMVASKRVTVEEDKIAAETLRPKPPTNLRILD